MSRSNSGRWIEEWNPEDDEFWAEKGARIARRNLTFSIICEFLGFAIWVLWSVTATQLNKAGFEFTNGQLYTLVALPALVGATIRIPYTLAVSKFGGRNWTIFSTLVLLIPVAAHVFLVSNPNTPFWAFLLGAATAGFGGGNFASSMSNISNFYPDKRKGFVLGVNAAGGNLGVAVSQGLTPLVVAWGWLTVAGGSQSGNLHLQNAALMWAPLIAIAGLCSWRFMDNLRIAKVPIKDQMVVLKRKHTWVITLIYVATFGSFVGYSAGMPLLMKTEFPHVSLSLAFLGPMVGSLTRPIGGWIADKVGGAKVTFCMLLGMFVCSIGLLTCLSQKARPGALTGFLVLSIALFAFAGMGNGSTYQLIPISFRMFHLLEVRGEGKAAVAKAVATARRETSAAVGFIGAMGAYGGWLIPQAYGLSLTVTGGPIKALEGVMILYVVCMSVLWRNFLRPSHPSFRRVVAEAEA